MDYRIQIVRRYLSASCHTAFIVIGVGFPFIPAVELCLCLVYFIYIIVQHNKPVITILRSFDNENNVDVIFANKLLSSLTLSNRLIWFNNILYGKNPWLQANSHPFTYLSLLTFTPLFFLVQIFVNDFSLIMSFIITICTIFLSFYLIEGITRRNMIGMAVFGFYMVLAFLFSKEIADFFGAEQYKVITIPIVIFCFLIIQRIWAIFFSGKVVQWKFKLILFKLNLIGNFTIFKWIIPRIPYLIEKIDVTDNYWKDLFQYIVKKSDVLMVEISNIKQQTNLFWEVEYIEKINKFHCLYICQENKLDEVKNELLKITNNLKKSIFFNYAYTTGELRFLISYNKSTEEEIEDFYSNTTFLTDKSMLLDHFKYISQKKLNQL